MITLEEGKKLLAENQAQFPMLNRQLGTLLGVHFMTVYRHAANIGVAKRTGWAAPYTLEEAQRILESIYKVKARKPRRSTVKIVIDLGQQEWEVFCKLADAEHLMPHMLGYKVLSTYIRQNAPLFS